MDSGGADTINAPDTTVVDSKEGFNKEEEEEEDSETKSLLPAAAKKGRMAGRRQRSGRRKVQWNDRNGNKLVQVLEFQPSDSEDEYGDSCICAIM